MRSWILFNWRSYVDLLVMFASSSQPGEDGGSGSEVDRSKKVKTHQMKKSNPKSEEVESSTGPVGQVVLPSKHHKISCY